MVKPTGKGCYKLFGDCLRLFEVGSLQCDPLELLFDLLGVILVA